MNWKLPLPFASLFLLAAIAIAGPQDAQGPEYLNEVVVGLEPGLPSNWASSPFGLTYQRSLRSDKSTHIYEVSNVQRAFELTESLRDYPGVRFVFVNSIPHYVQDSFYPNDPYFFPNQPEPGEFGQWHLENTVNTARDSNIVPAWARDVTGQNVLIGIVDDGLPIDHPDLSPGYTAEASWDFGFNDEDPSPSLTDDRHGTCCAGVAGARGGNGIGVSGSAPLSRLAGLRMNFFSPFSTTADFYDAHLYRNDIIQVKSHSYGQGSPFVDDSLITSAYDEPGNIIHVISGGNSRVSSNRDTNKRMRSTNPNNVVVAAIGYLGQVASYSSFGANVTCSGYSSTFSGQPRITSTDRQGSGTGYDGMTDFDYTNQFGGTSSSTPLVAGVMAMLKQVKPTADVRFAKHLLARTSQKVDPNNSGEESDGGWRTNSGGVAFNQNYGFGNIDADALTLAATQYAGVTSPSSWSSGTQTVNTAIPDLSTTGLSRSVTCPVQGRVESVEVRIDAVHQRRGDLQVWLTSPSGYKSRLCIWSGSDSAPNLNWKFLANPFWNEMSQGTWTVTVTDDRNGGSPNINMGTWTSYWVKVHVGQPTVQKSVSGTVNLGHWNYLKPVTGTLTVRYPGSADIIAQGPATVSTTGLLTAEIPLPEGTPVDVSFKAPTWLRQQLPTMTIAAGNLTGLAFSLKNGDCDGDNTVTTDDYLILSQSFDLSLGDPGYDARADLDGNDVVTTDDYLALSTNFDETGD